MNPPGQTDRGGYFKVGTDGISQSPVTDATGFANELYNYKTTRYHLHLPNLAVLHGLSFPRLFTDRIFRNTVRREDLESGGDVYLLTSHLRSSPLRLDWNTSASGSLAPSRTL